jgi:hypothetical protein
MMYRFVERERASYPVATMCRVLEVSTSGFWAWSKRPPSARACSDAELTALIGTPAFDGPQRAERARERRADGERHRLRPAAWRAAVASDAVPVVTRFSRVDLAIAAAVLCDGGSTTTATPTATERAAHRTARSGSVAPLAVKP